MDILYAQFTAQTNFIIKNLCSLGRQPQIGDDQKVGEKEPQDIMSVTFLLTRMKLFYDFENISIKKMINKLYCLTDTTKMGRLDSEKHFFQYFSFIPVLIHIRRKKYSLDCTLNE